MKHAGLRKLLIVPRFTRCLPQVYKQHLLGKRDATTKLSASCTGNGDLWAVNHASVGLGYCLQATEILLVTTTNSLIDEVRHQCPVMIAEWTFIYISPGKVT